MTKSDPLAADAEAKAILDKLFGFLESDAQQNNSLPEPYRFEITGGIACDQLPNARGEFGRTPSNPIPTNGPAGEVLYLSRLRTRNGNPIMFHRVRAEEGISGIVDVYEVLSLDGAIREITLLVDVPSKEEQEGATWLHSLC